MAEMERTQVGQMRVRKRRLTPEACCEEDKQSEGIVWKEREKTRSSDTLLRNMGVAACLVLFAVTLRSGALPELSAATDAVLAAATDDSLLDDQLGRLSFVSSLFPEATLVFGENDADALSLPVSGGVVVHAWSEAEPYMSWRSNGRSVTAAAPGEVIGVYHGNGDERLVQVMGSDGLSCLYGNLETVSVTLGDAVTAGEPIGTLMTGADCVFEVRRDGLSIDPALYLGGV